MHLPNLSIDHGNVSLIIAQPLRYRSPKPRSGSTLQVFNGTRIPDEYWFRPRGVHESKTKWHAGRRI